MYSENFTGLDGATIHDTGGGWSGGGSTNWALSTSAPIRVPSGSTAAKNSAAGNLRMSWNSAFYGQGANTPVNASGSGAHYLRFYAYIATPTAGDRQWLLDWSISGTKVSSFLWVNHNGSVQYQWASNQLTGSIDNYPSASSDGVVPIGAPFRLEIRTALNGDSKLRVFSGSNLYADHSSPANYTEYGPAGAKRYYGAPGSANRQVGISALTWASWPNVDETATDAPLAGSGFDCIGFSTLDWVGPRPQYDFPYWGASSHAAA